MPGGRNLSIRRNARNIGLNRSLNWRHIIVGWAVIVPIVLASIAGLNAMTSARDSTQRSAVWDGVVNPRHDPAAIQATDDIKEDDAH